MKSKYEFIVNLDCINICCNIQVGISKLKPELLENDFVGNKTLLNNIPYHKSAPRCALSSILVFTGMYLFFYQL